MYAKGFAKAACIALSVCLVACLVPSIATAQGMADVPEHIQRAAAPDAVADILFARSFTVSEGFTYHWRADQPTISTGHLLVLNVDPLLSRPRQIEVPVLFADDTPVQLLNTGYPSGNMVVLVPDWIDLDSARFYFGTTELPESIDAENGQRELLDATARGVRPFSARTLAAARAAGGEMWQVEDAADLMLRAADLIEVYSPEEMDLVESLTVERVGR